MKTNTASSQPGSIIDPFGRTISYLRVSVTDRCDFRCVYCMSEDMTFLPRAQVLTLEEIEQVARAFVELGVNDRLTRGLRRAQRQRHLRALALGTRHEPLPRPAMGQGAGSAGGVSAAPPTACTVANRLSQSPGTRT